MSDYTFCNELVSDLHKDAYGFRPTEYFWEEWTQASDEVKQEIWDRLLVTMDEQEKAEQRREEQALVTFRATLRKVMNEQGVDWRTAMRWLMQADDEQDVDHWLWKQGLSYEKSGEIRRRYSQAEAA